MDQIRLWDLLDSGTLDSLEIAIVQGAEAVGIPFRGCCLLHDRTVLVFEVDKSLKPVEFHQMQLPGDAGVPKLPFVVALAGPFGVWHKIVAEPKNTLPI
jgi:hypothetical protein